MSGGRGLTENADDHPENGGKGGHGPNHRDRVIAELVMHELVHLPDLCTDLGGKGVELIFETFKPILETVETSLKNVETGLKTVDTGFGGLLVRGPHGKTRHQSVCMLGSEQLFEFSIERVSGGL